MADSELEEAITIRKFRIVQTEGSRQVSRETKTQKNDSLIHIEMVKSLRN